MDKKLFISIRKSVNSIPDHKQIFIHALLDICIFSISFFFANDVNSIYLRLLSVPLLSTLMFRNFSLMHDATHNAVSKNRNINNFIGIWSGGLCFLPFSNWKEIHQEHHFWSGNIDHDPSMSLLKKLPKMNSRFVAFLSYCWNCWIPIMALLQHVSFWGHSIKISLKNLSNFQMNLSVLAPVIIWTSVIYFSRENYFASTFAPALMLYLIAVEIVNFPHHLQMPQLQNEERLPAWQQHRGARSCMYPKWFAKYVVLNFNYHIEHHLFPDVPWYRLDQLHEPMKRVLQENYNTDSNLNWNLKNRKKDLLVMIQAPKIHFDKEMPKEVELFKMTP